MKRVSFLSSFLIFVSLAFSQDSAKLNEQAIIAWLQQKAIPIKYVEAGKSFSDLQPLKQILKDVTVVGLGENTHGSREFFQLKHRLLEFLVKEMNFTGFVLEAGYGACEPINNYVLYGEGNLSSVLTAQGYVLWDTEEMAAMIEWMRSYNQSVKDHKKVSFHGIDIMYNEAGREKVLAYLQKYRAEIAPATDSIFRLLSQQEKQWSKDKDKNLLAYARVKLKDLIVYLNDHKNQLTTASSSKEFAQTVKYIQVMTQMFILHLTDSLDSSSTLNMKRSQLMGENMLYLMEEKPKAKFVVWESNVHIADGHIETAEPNLGHVLKKKLRDKYYAIAFEFNQGSYLSRLRVQGQLADLKVENVPAAPKGYLAYYLSQTKKGSLFWNLRNSSDSPTVNQWLRQPQKMRAFAWYNDNKSTPKVDLISRYDGIIFIENGTATRPTKNALATVARGEGL